MNKYLSLCIALALLGAAAAAVLADPFLIVPERSIGQTRLGRNGAYYLGKLPAPTASDAGMSQNNLVWLSPASRDTLYIHTVSNGVLSQPGPGVTIDEIRVTSSHYHTDDGLRAGSTYAQIGRRFPALRRLGDDSIYADITHGIAFEFAHRPSPGTRCIAITVYPSGQDISVATAAEVQETLQTSTVPRKKVRHAQ